MPATSLTALAFDIPGHPSVSTFGMANGYCGAGAPRFNVESTLGGTCFLGCNYGVKTQDPATGWWEIRFDAPFDAFPGCLLPNGDITKITIIFDEGDDQGPGNVILDNIRVNGRVVGKPTGE
jgi:hypothetical protein